MRYVTLALLAAMSLSSVGCGTEPAITGTVPEQLEAITVDSGGSSGSPVSMSGALTVTGSGRDYTLSLDVGGTPKAISVHSPASSPLSGLSGVTAEIALTEALFGGPSLFVADDAGPAYAAVFGDSPAVTEAEARFGKGFVRWGDEVGSETNGIFVWSYRKAVFKTDDGDVTVDPGDVALLKIAGATYRAVVVASYEVSTNPDADALPACSPESMLGLEMLRVKEAPPAEPRITRPLNAQVAFAGCTAPGGRE